jgi:ketose-bisphosphate aldolase
MSCVSFREVLPAARKGGYGVAAFNILDYNTTRAVVRGAEELKAPVIVQVSVKTIKLWGYDAIASWYRQLATPATVPVVLHLDHCNDLGVIEKCIAAGWSSVMMDASSKPFEENMALTRQAMALAKPKGVTMEAELGEIGGVEDDMGVTEEMAHLVDPEKAIRFCRELQPDVFAPAIGTAHGFYKGEPKIAFDRLEKIHRAVDTPFALHGGTGLKDEVFHRCIALGCAKVNISTMLKHSFITAFADHAKSGDDNPLNYITKQFDALKADVKTIIQTLGSAGKAA